MNQCVVFSSMEAEKQKRSLFHSISAPFFTRLEKKELTKAKKRETDKQKIRATDGVYMHTWSDLQCYYKLSIHCANEESRRKRYMLTTIEALPVIMSGGPGWCIASKIKSGNRSTNFTLVCRQITRKVKQMSMQNYQVVCQNTIARGYQTFRISNFLCLSNLRVYFTHPKIPL